MKPSTWGNGSRQEEVNLGGWAAPSPPSLSFVGCSWDWYCTLKSLSNKRLLNDWLQLKAKCPKVASCSGLVLSFGLHLKMMKNLWMCGVAVQYGHHAQLNRRDECTARWRRRRCSRGRGSKIKLAGQSGLLRSYSNKSILPKDNFAFSTKIPLKWKIHIGWTAWWATATKDTREGAVWCNHNWEIGLNQHGGMEPRCPPSPWCTRCCTYPVKGSLQSLKIQLLRLRNDRPSWLVSSLFFRPQRRKSYGCEESPR